MKTHKISVTVGSGGIQVAPDTLTMTSDDEVYWEGNGPGFSIEFDDRSPFTEMALAHSAATQKRRPRTRGRFKYTVVSDENPDVRLDPAIIVDEPPTGNP